MLDTRETTGLLLDEELELLGLDVDELLDLDVDELLEDVEDELTFVDPDVFAGDLSALLPEPVSRAMATSIPLR